MNLTRRQFLGGLLALSASAAIPVEIVKAAELIYSSSAPISKPPAYILINGKMTTFYDLHIYEPISPLVDNRCDRFFCQYPQLAEVSLDILGNESHLLFFERLHSFDFEIVYSEIPYSIKGRGHPKEYSSELPLDEMGMATFTFDAEIERYIDNSCLV